jgi:hypothetical protein
MLKLYAHVDATAQPDDEWPVALTEATIEATPAELRRIAAFLNAAADKIDTQGKSFEHAHLHDEQPGFGEAPQLIVFNPEAAAN